MLDFLRRKKRSWIITFLLGVIIIVFVAFYGGSPPATGIASNVAVVNGDVISQREFMVHYQRAIERYREMFKASLTPELLKSLNIKGALLEEMIETRLLLQEARRLGLTATDEELMTWIGQIPEFHVNGRFNKEHYLQLLRANRMTPAEFEQQQRSQLTMQRLIGVLIDNVHVTEDEVRSRYQFEQERINLQFVRLPASNHLPGVKVTDEDIQKFYERNQESLKEPLKVQVEYLAYPFEQFGAAAEVTEKEIQEHYEAHRTTKFASPKQAKARYILVQLQPGADGKQKDAAQARAMNIVQAARSGKDFAELAKRESADPSSAQGGDIGWLTEGQLPETLDQKVFALAKGEVSDPIETPTGFHIIKVDDIREEKVQTLRQAAPAITREIKIEKGRHAAAKSADGDREKALSGNDLASVAKESGAAVKTTGLFGSGEVVAEIGPVQEFYKSALSLSANELSPVIEGSNAYYILRVKERREAFVPPLEAVRERIEKGLRESRAYDAAVQQANALLEQLKTEKDLAKLARQHKLTLQETGYFTRSTQPMPKLGELQGVPPGGLAVSGQKPVPERIYTQDDAAILIAFKDSRDADMEQFDKNKESLMQQALAEHRQRMMLRFKDDLKAVAKIEVNAAALEEI